MGFFSEWLRSPTRSERERDVLELKRREVEALERIAAKAESEKTTQKK